MVLKPGTGRLWHCVQVPSPVGKWNLHLHKVGQQQEAWSALKLPGIRLCWPWTSENTVDQQPADYMAPQTITDCGKLYTGPQATWILCLSSLPPDSGTLISKGNANLLSSENITLDHSAAVQSRRFWRCLLFKSGLTQGMRQLKPMSCIRLCVVVLEALTPAAVHSLWISPTFLNGFCFTILSRVRLSLLLVHFFLPHLFLPFAPLLMCLETELCEQPALFCKWPFVSCPPGARCQCRLLDNLSSQQSSPWLCSLQN